MYCYKSCKRIMGRFNLYKTCNINNKICCKSLGERKFQPNLKFKILLDFDKKTMLIF